MEESLMEVFGEIVFDGRVFGGGGFDERVFDGRVCSERVWCKEFLVEESV